AFAVLAEHGYEAAELDGVGAQAIVVADERDAAGLAAPAQGDDKPAAGTELRPPGGRDVPGADGDDDPVVRCVVGVADGAVGGGDVDVAAAGGVEGLAGVRGHLGVDVDRADVSGPAGQVGQQRGVVAGAGADLQDAVAGADIELVEHH